MEAKTLRPLFAAMAKLTSRDAMIAVCAEADRVTFAAQSGQFAFSVPSPESSAFPMRAVELDRIRRALNIGDTLTFDATVNHMRIASGSAEVRAPMLAPVLPEWPWPPQIPNAHAINPNRLADALAFLLPATNGVMEHTAKALIRSAQGGFWETTDGHRLHRVPDMPTFGADQFFPPHILEPLVALLRKADPEIGVALGKTEDNKNFCLRFQWEDGTAIWARWAPFVGVVSFETDRIFDRTDKPHAVAFNAELMRDAVKVGQRAIKQAVPCVEIHVGETTARVSLEDANDGSFSKTIHAAAVSRRENGKQIAVNPQYLLDAIGEGGRVTVRYAEDPLAPILIDRYAAQMHAAIMPIRLDPPKSKRR